MAGAGGDAGLSESLASSNVYDRGGDVKVRTTSCCVSHSSQAGFLSMRAPNALLKIGYQRRWFVLDKRQQLLSHGPLVVPYPDGDGGESDDRCVFTPALFGDRPAADGDLFLCNSCSAEESQVRARARVCIVIEFE
jgi:hypothetical protein